MSALPAVAVGVSLWPLENPVLALAGSAGVVVVAHLLTLVPGLTVVGDRLVVRRFFSSQSMDGSTVSVKIVPGRVLNYKSWILFLVVGDGRSQDFFWITWTRHDLAHPWNAPEPPPRALRFVEALEQSLAGDPRAGVAGERRSDQPESG